MHLYIRLLVTMRMADDKTHLYLSWEGEKAEYFGLKASVVANVIEAELAYTIEPVNL
jgi:hypothetical protein